MARSAGIRELKDNLSEYVRRAEAGEQIAVTAHGRIVAVLGPADKRARGRRLSKLDELIADGRARAPLAELPADFFDAWPIADLPKGAAAALIDADREED